MSSDGPTCSSCNSSPRIASPTIPRLRVADNNIADLENQPGYYSDYSDIVVVEDDDHDNSNESTAGGCGGSHHHHYFYPAQCPHVIRRILLRTRMIFSSMSSGKKNTSRKILWMLMLMLVMMIFLKAAFIGVALLEANRRSIENNGQLMLQKFKHDYWASAHRAITERETNFSKHVPERFACK